MEKQIKITKTSSRGYVFRLNIPRASGIVRKVSGGWLATAATPSGVVTATGETQVVAIMAALKEVV